MEKRFWNAHPVLKLIIPFILGILISNQIMIKNNQIIGLMFFLPFLLTLLSFKIRFAIENRFDANFLIFLSLLLFGFGITQVKQKNLPQHIPNYKASKGLVAFELLDNPKVGERSISSQAKILKSTNSKVIGQKTLVYLPRQAKVKKYDVVLADIYLNEIDAPTNPYEFNYRRYLQNNESILYRVFIKKNSGYQIIPSHYTPNFIERLRNKGLIFIDESVNERNAPIAKALLLGYRDELSRTTQKEFKDSGTMHILAVSGLHVGIIFILVSSVLGFLGRIKPIPKNLTVILSIATIWIFVLLTGAKASVTRAGIMFTLFVFGINYPQRSFALNNLAIAGFIILCLDPLSLFDVGFQLSFSAVIGILLIVPFLQNLIKQPKRKIVKYFLDIVYVSIAAQLATLPFTLFYFNQFPTYGLITNLAAIPIAFGIVSLGVIGFVFTAIPIITNVIGKLLDLLLMILQQVNEFVSDLPAAVISNIHLSEVDFIILLITIVVLLILVKSKRKTYLFVTLIGLISLSASVAIQKWNVENKNELLVYNIYKNQVLQYQKGREAHIIAIAPITDDAFNFNMKPNLNANYITKKHFYTFEDSIKHDFFMKDRILLLRSQSMYISPTNQILIPSTDYLLYNNLDYKNLYKSLEVPESQKAIIANTFSNKGVADTIARLHFLNSEGFVRISDTLATNIN